MLNQCNQQNVALFQQQFLQAFAKILIQKICDKKAELKKNTSKNGFKNTEDYQIKFAMLSFEILYNNLELIQNQRLKKKLEDLMGFFDLSDITNYQELFFLKQKENEIDTQITKSFDHNYDQINHLFKDTHENYLEIQEQIKREETKEDEFLQEMDVFLKNFNKLFEAKKLFSFAQNKKFQQYQQFLDQYIQYKDDFEGLKQLYINPNETYNEKDFESIKSSQKSLNQSKKNSNEKLKENQMSQSNFSQKKNLQEEIQKFCNKERNFMKQKITDLKQQLKKMHQENLLLKQKLKQEEIKNESLEERLSKLGQDSKFKDNQIDTFFRQISQHIQYKQKSDLKTSHISQSINTDLQKTITNKKFIPQKFSTKKFQFQTFSKNPYYGEVNNNLQESQFQKHNSKLLNCSLQNSIKEPSYTNFSNINQFKSRIQENQDFLNSLNSDINKILSRNREKTSLSQSMEKQRNFRSSSLQSQQSFGFKDNRLSNLKGIKNFDGRENAENMSLRSNSFNDKENISSFRNSHYQNFQKKFSQGIFQYRNQLIFKALNQTSFAQKSQ